MALDIRDQNNDIWIADLGRLTLTPLTADPGNDYYPVWTPDRRRIIFQSSRLGGSVLSQAPGWYGYNPIVCFRQWAPLDVLSVARFLNDDFHRKIDLRQAEGRAPQPSVVLITKCRDLTAQ